MGPRPVYDGVMVCVRQHIKSIVAASCLAVWFTGPLAADQSRLDQLYDRLAAAETAQEAAQVGRDIRNEWSKSGSAAIDLLLSRGQDALTAGDYVAAVEHLTAAIDHDPAFAQAWHLRATAYYMSGNIGPALSDLGEALRLNPRHYAALQGLAVILEEMGKPQEALAVFRAVLAMDPMDADIEGAVLRLEQSLEGRAL